MPALAAAENNDEYINRARALVEAMEGGDSDGVTKLIDELTTLRETQLFREIGMLTRELHDSVKSFCEDAKVAKLAHDDIPDARNRLNYVITLTADATHKTINAVETNIPVAKDIGDRAAALGVRWESFRDRRMAVAEFRQLSDELSEFFNVAKDSAAKLHTGLSDVLMAQEFQDLTGQIIRRVIGLVEEVEEKLVSVITLAGSRLTEENQVKGKDIEAEGPLAPDSQREDVVKSQDEVDDLLASLGF